MAELLKNKKIDLVATKEKRAKKYINTVRGKS